MAAVLEMNSMQKVQSTADSDIQVQISHSSSESENVNEEDGGQSHSEKTGQEENNNSSALDGATMTKVDIDALSVMEELPVKPEGCPKSTTSTPATDNSSHSSVEFSKDKDAPEASTIVYDFNMVKQKTLPRINFGDNSIIRAFSSHSKSYIITWTLMPLSILICLIVLILYLIPQ